MSEQEIYFSGTVKTGPETLAKIFWGMDNDQQAQFFEALALAEDEDFKKWREIGSPGLKIYGSQWEQIGRTLKRPEFWEGRRVLMEIAAPLYLHTLTYAGQT